MPRRILLELTLDEADRVKYAINDRRRGYAEDVAKDVSALAKTNAYRASLVPPLPALDRLDHNEQTNRTELMFCDGVLAALEKARRKA